MIDLKWIIGSQWLGLHPLLVGLEGLRLGLKSFWVCRQHDQSEIPRGCYCYGRHRGQPCVFLDYNRFAYRQSCGWCHLLRAGDWQRRGTFLLWDQCKECGINDDDEDEDEGEDQHG